MFFSNLVSTLTSSYASFIFLFFPTIPPSEALTPSSIAAPSILMTLLISADGCSGFWDWSFGWDHCPLCSSPGTSSYLASSFRGTSMTTLREPLDMATASGSYWSCLFNLACFPGVSTCRKVHPSPLMHPWRVLKYMHHACCFEFTCSIFAVTY